MINIIYLIPEIIILSSLCFIILFDIFITNNKRYISYYLIQLSLFASFILLLSYYKDFTNYDSNLYSSNIFSVNFKIFIIFSLTLIFHYTYKFFLNFNLYKTEYFIISLFALLGMMIIISSEHLLLLYLGIELLSLSLYSLIAFDKKSSLSSEAAIKYYILGAISSGFLLFGISLVYGLTGSLYFNDILSFINNLQDSSLDVNITNIGFIFSLTFILVSLAFKFGAAPFHMWVPDVYHGSIVSTTLLLSTLPKVAVFVIFIKLLAGMFSGLFIFWSDMLVILALISVIIGNIIAIAQENIKRMLAYSTIANVGFILIGISIGTNEAYVASMFYTVAYIITTIAAFGLISQLIYSKQPIENIKELSGMNSKFPVQSFLMLIIMLSFIGIPPFIGFYAKLFIIHSLISVNSIYISIFLLLMTVIGAYYYLRIIKIIYFDPNQNQLQLAFSSPITALYVLALVILGIFPNILSKISYVTIASIF